MVQRKAKKRQKRRKQEDPVILLLAMARILNECEKVGIRPRLKHGIVFTDAGYVLPAKEGKWAARPLKKPLGALWQLP